MSTETGQDPAPARSDPAGLGPQTAVDRIERRVGQMSLRDERGRLGYARSADGRIAPDTYLLVSDVEAGEWDPIARIVRDLSGLLASARAVPIGSQVRCEGCGSVWPCPDYRNTADALGGSL